MWGLVPIDTPDKEHFEWGTDIASFLDRCSHHNSIYYFHNLKFDGRFIIDWLLNNGYEHLTEDNFEDKTFKTLISDMGQFYSITVRWENGHTTEFRDSLKKLPMAVRRVAKSFDLEMSKGELDYEKFRPIGHQPTEEELDYLMRDVCIIGQAMKTVIDSGMKKLTVASDAMHEFKQLNGIEKFDRLFPVLSMDMDKEIRRAYRGGFTYADERFKGRQLKRSGIVFDVNSLYPSVMKNYPIPYGMPEFFRTEPKPTASHPLVIFSVTFTATLKPNHIPCIQIKGNNMFLGTEYLKVIEEPTTLMVTSVDWALYNEHYDIDVLAYGGGWRFRATTGLFDSYIDKWSAIKASETGGKREIAKLHLNSLYGKFATNPNVTSKIPVLKDGVVRLVRGESETRPPVYTAAGAFITAYARDITIRAAQANYESFAYADTDSLHLLQDHIPDSLEVHPTKLGAWKFEYSFIDAQYVRAKFYLEQKELENVHKDDCRPGCELRHNFENRVAGLPTDISGTLGFEDLIEGKVLHGKLNPKAVPGGVVLKDVPFELKLA